MTNETSKITVQDLRERCEALAQLVRDYDNYLLEQLPLAYKHWKRPALLRSRARDEDVEIEEPGGKLL